MRARADPAGALTELDRARQLDRHSPLGLRLAQIIPQFLIGTGAPARELLKFVAFALWPGRWSMLVGEPARSSARRAALPGVLAAGGLLLSLAFVAAGSDALITRNIIALWIPPRSRSPPGSAPRARVWPGSR